MLGNVHPTDRLRRALAELLLAALVVTASPALGGTLYQACPTGCCAFYGTEIGCDRTEPAGVASETMGCSCQGSCDSACSECAYFHACLIEPPREAVPIGSFRFALAPPAAHLIGHPSRSYRPPRLAFT